LEQRNGRAVRKGNIIAKQYADNKVDCFIYAVEKSLDSYRFNLLHNKQLFISQLKSRNLATRIIDEGAMDESGGVHFSEYVAILSGNDDLLEKTKLEKKLAVLESERLAYHRNKGNAKGKLNERTSEIEKNNVFIGRFTRDWEYLNNVAPVDAETGLRPNPLRLDSVDSDNIEILGNRLAAINQKARTEDDYMKIGTLFDFRILVRTEKTYNGDTQALQNKFMVEGLDGIKYTYHNGYIAKDPKLAVMYFINALERIPGMIEKRQKDNAELSKDLPVLQQIVADAWPKEAELKQLGEELAAVNRKIQLTLKPVDKHESGEEKKTEVEEPKLVSGSDVIPDSPGKARHVPSMEILNPVKELKKIS
jgi:helicase domain-containing protein (fragment)